MRILVVDDDLFILEMVRLMLQDRFEILTASDGRKGLEIARSDKIDLIILDWMMPDMDGAELCRTIRSRYDSSSIYILMLTPEARKEDIVLAAQQGAAGYIVKPFTKATLEDKVNLILTKLGLK